MHLVQQHHLAYTSITAVPSTQLQTAAKSCEQHTPSTCKVHIPQPVTVTWPACRHVHILVWAEPGTCRFRRAATHKRGLSTKSMTDRDAEKSAPPWSQVSRAAFNVKSLQARYEKVPRLHPCSLQSTDNTSCRPLFTQEYTGVGGSGSDVHHLQQRV